MNMNNTKVVVTLAAALLLILAVISFGGGNKSAPNRKLTESHGPLAEVTVMAVKAEDHQAELVAYGEARALKQLDISSEVSGKVVAMNSKLNIGQSFLKGELLLKIEDSAYQQALFEAKANLAQMELAYAQAEQNHRQAKDNWKRSGLKGAPQSSLVFNEPQLKLAKANLQSAQKRLLRAQYEVDQSKIIAPFNMELTSRDVEQGAVINAGTKLLSAFDRRLIEVRLPLSERQWRNIDPELGQKVELFDQTGGQRWLAKAVRAEKTVDTISRQRSLIVELVLGANGTLPMYPGSYVKAMIPGKEYQNLWRVPASSISDMGELWYVTEAMQLAKKSVDVIFSKDGNVYVAPFLKLDYINVLPHPLSSYMPGMKVTLKTHTASSKKTIAEQAAGA